MDIYLRNERAMGKGFWLGWRTAKLGLKEGFRRRGAPGAPCYPQHTPKTTLTAKHFMKDCIHQNHLEITVTTLQDGPAGKDTCYQD